MPALDFGNPVTGPILLGVLGIVLLVADYFRRSAKKGKGPKVEVSAGKKQTVSPLPRIFSIISGIPILGDYQENIKLTLYAITMEDERTLRSRAVTILINSFLISLGIFMALAMFLDNTLYNLCVSFLMSGLIFDAFVKNSIRSRDKIMEHLPDALSDLKHYFISEKTVEKAFVQTIKRAPHGLGIHLNIICEMLQMPFEHAKQKLEAYKEQCSNKYLKILAAYCLLTEEYGDIVEEGESHFNKNMNHLIAEVRNEHRKKKLIQSSLIGLKFFVILPLFLIPAIRDFMLNNIEISELQDFYVSNLGFLAFASSCVITLISFIVYNELVKTQDDLQFITLKKKSWEEILLQWKPLKKTIGFFIPAIGSIKYQKIFEKMVSAGRVEKMDWLYLRKVLCSIAAFAVISVTLYMTKEIAIHQVYEDVTYGLQNRNYVLNHIESMQKAGFENLQKKMIANDRRILQSIIQSKLNQERDVERLQEKVYRFVDQYRYDTKVPELIEYDKERIFKKLLKLRETRVFTPDLLLVGIVPFVFFFFPNMLLNILVFMQRFSLFDEVLRFQTVILLLIHNPRVTVEMILDWLTWFSEIFQVQLVEAKNNYSDKEQGGVNALNKLMESVNYRPFQQIVHNLILVETQLPLKDAFAGLEQDHKFNAELRKDNTEFMIEAKVEWAKVAVNISLYFSLIVMMFIPILYSIFKLFYNINTMMSSGGM